MLQQEQLPDSDQCLKEMVEWCRKWDDVYGYDATAQFSATNDAQMHCFIIAQLFIGIAMVSEHRS
jgi:hypothetical protein